jgi:hypothetical protein
MIKLPRKIFGYCKVKMAKEHTSVWRACSVMVQTSISNEGVMEEEI